MNNELQEQLDRMEIRYIKCCDERLKISTELAQAYHKLGELRSVFEGNRAVTITAINNAKAAQKLYDVKNLTYKEIFEWSKKILASETGQYPDQALALAIEIDRWDVRRDKSNDV